MHQQTISAAKRNRASIATQQDGVKMSPRASLWQSAAQKEIFCHELKRSERKLHEWLTFPQHQKNHVGVNMIFLPMVWLLWTTKNIIALDPADPTLKDRLATM